VPVAHSSNLFWGMGIGLKPYHACVRSSLSSLKLKRYKLVCWQMSKIIEVYEVATINKTSYSWTWLSILPSLLAILVALIFRQGILALFLGIWIGAWISHGKLCLFRELTGGTDPVGEFKKTCSRHDH